MYSPTASNCLCKPETNFPSLDSPRVLDREKPLLENDGTSNGVSREAPVPRCVILVVRQSIEFFPVAAGSAPAAGFSAAAFAAVSDSHGQAGVLSIAPDVLLGHAQKGRRGLDSPIRVAVEEHLQA